MSPERHDDASSESASTAPTGEGNGSLREPLAPSRPDAAPTATGAGHGGPGERFERLLAVMDTLRSPGGCPWDAEQTHESLLRYLVEESYEVVEAVEALEPSQRRRDELVEELGDVLLQVVFHARIGQEHPQPQRFDVTDVLAAVTDKLVRRHPAVFGTAQPGTGQEPSGTTATESRTATVQSGMTGGYPAAGGGHGSASAPVEHGPESAGSTRSDGAAQHEPGSADPAGAPGAVGEGQAGDPAASSEAPARERPSTAELSARWDAVKREEKPHRTRVFDGIPPALPALAYGEKALSKARRHGVAGVRPVEPELPPEQREAEERDLGEALLRQVETASARGLDAERALRAAVRRFVRENDGPLAG